MSDAQTTIDNYTLNGAIVSTQNKTYHPAALISSDHSKNTGTVVTKT